MVLIIGILSAIALPQYQKAVLKARATEAFINLRTLTDAQERYKMANGSYATDTSLIDIEVQDGFYRYYFSGESIYAGPKNGSTPFFEKEISTKILYCRGTAAECKMFGTESPSWATDGNYWIVKF